MLLRTFKRNILNRFLFTTSIRSRLLLYFIGLILLPTSIISYTIYAKSTSIITNKINTSLEEKLAMIAININQKLEAVNDISAEIYLNRDLIRVLSSQHPFDKTALVSEMSMLDKLLENYSVPNVTQTLLIPRLYLINRPEYLMYSFSDKVSDISLIEQAPWYLNLPPKAEYTVVGLDKVVISSTTIPTIKIAKRLFGLDDMLIPYNGLLTIDVDIDYFNNILNKSKPTTGTSTFIIDKHSSIIISPNTALLGKAASQEIDMSGNMTNNLAGSGSFIEKRSNGNMFVSYQHMSDLNWTIVSITPMSELNGELNAFNKFIYIVIILCAIVALLMALLLADNISFPIRKLVKSMKIVQNGNFEISLEYTRNDEFSYLFKTYNKMLIELKSLIDKLFISEKIKREAELKALQAQINPHFLYNTLDSVNWMAIKHDVPDISTMVTSLSDTFRYSLSKGNNIIPLLDEKKQVESYLRIQKIRFKDKLDFSIDFPQEILGYLTVKLILQPIVENSIIHGIEKRRGIGTIVIKGERLDYVIEISISDNGVGTDVEELNAILTDPNSSKSFAIQNVNKRIKHFFGNEYGIRFYDNEESGVTVRMRFPAVTTMEGYDVNDDHSR